MIVEGNGIRAAARMRGVAVNTNQKLIRDMGIACLRLHAAKVVGLPCAQIQADEAWAFVYSRQKNVPADKRGMASETCGFGRPSARRRRLSRLGTSGTARPRTPA